MGRWTRAAGAATLALALGGCWLQPDVDGARSGWNRTETELGPDVVGGLAVVGRTPVPNSLGTAYLVPRVSSGGTVYLGNGPNEVVAVDASTGVIRWTSEVVDVENKLAVNQLALVGGELVVPYVEEAWSSPWAPGSGGVARLDPATGAVLGRQPGEPAYAVAESGGTVAVERFGGLLASGRRVDWAFRGGAACVPGLGAPCGGNWALVGDRLLWSRGTSASGFSAACPPALMLGSCGPDWEVQLDEPDGYSLGDLAGVGNDRVAYATRAGFAVLDTADGTIRWRARTDIANPGLAVADDLIVAANRRDRLAVFPADGCGAPTCPPRWEAAPMDGPNTLGTGPVVADGVVYYAALSTVYAYALHGCGAPTCPPLAAVDVGARIRGGPLIDGGRVHVATHGDAVGHLVTLDTPT